MVVSSGSSVSLVFGGTIVGTADAAADMPSFAATALKPSVAESMMQY